VLLLKLDGLVKEIGTTIGKSTTVEKAVNQLHRIYSLGGISEMHSINRAWLDLRGVAWAGVSIQGVGLAGAATRRDRPDMGRQQGGELQTMPSVRLWTRLRCPPLASSISAS
jgi:hypothetical protein